MCRLPAPRVESLGYRTWYGGGFGREKAGWVEGFFLQVVGETLAKADVWFQRFQSFAEVVEQYRTRNRLPSAPLGDLCVTAVLNYGLLLLLADRKQEAARWLRFAGALLARPTYWDAKARAFSHGPGPGLKLLKPTKDDELRRRVIDAALAKTEFSRQASGRRGAPVAGSEILVASRRSRQSRTAVAS